MLEVQVLFHDKIFYCSSFPGVWADVMRNVHSLAHHFRCCRTSARTQCLRRVNLAVPNKPTTIITFEEILSTILKQHPSTSIQELVTCSGHTSVLFT